MNFLRMKYICVKHKCKKFRFSSIIPPIQNGDKIKFVYLKSPNPVQDTVIATSDYLPEIFDLDKYIDREVQFDKSFLEPLKSITSVINWEVEKRSTLEDFFG